MAITHSTNWLEGQLSGVKEYGAWRAMTATVLSYGWVGTDSAVLGEVADDIEANVLAIGAVHPSYENLYLKSISSRVKADQTTVESTLEFVPVSEYEGIGVLIPETTLQQEETQVDRLGNALYTSHTYTADPDFGSLTISQGGSVAIDVPQFLLRSSLKMRIKFPIDFAKGWLNHLNSADWQGGGHETWKCTECRPELFDVSTTPWTYMVHFTFQYKGSGWQPSIVFTDQRDGKPPAGLVAGLGYKAFYWYWTKDFSELFPAGD